MENNENLHMPVMTNEVVTHLITNPDGIYIDATFGRGGHTNAILGKLSPKGRLIAIDKDFDAIEYARAHITDPRFSIEHASFSELSCILSKHHLQGCVTGILFDLGVSSPQLDNPERGFSFMQEGALDMRMDTTQGVSAKEWIANVSEEELSTVLWKYGEEKFSRRIARAIVAARAVEPIETTTQLANIVAKANPKWEKHKHAATRSFQAIRVAINEELDDLTKALEQCLEGLAIGGRLAVISFHSLEDRIVKQFINLQEKGIELPRGLPVKNDYYQSKMKKLGKAIKPTSEECYHNPRARSAMLRIAEKLS